MITPGPLKAVKAMLAELTELCGGAELASSLPVVLDTDACIMRSLQLFGKLNQCPLVIDSGD